MNEAELFVIPANSGRERECPRITLKRKRLILNGLGETPLPDEK